MFKWMRLITIPRLTLGRRGWAVMVHTLSDFGIPTALSFRDGWGDFGITRERERERG